MELEMGKTTQKTQSQPRLAVRSKAREDKRGDRVADDASFLGVASGVSTTTGGVYLHPTALCESSRVGGGTRVWAFAHVLDGAIIGRNCNIGDHAYVEGGVRMGDGVIVKNGVMLWDGVTLEDYVFVGPGAVFTNDRYPRSRHLPEAAERYNRREQWTIPTVVRRGASIGAGAVILCGVTIGSFATVAAGAVVTRDVVDHALVVGSPGRLAGWVCRCGVTLDGTQTCPNCQWRIAKGE
jgi:acetyltransferase-like isoleucine patch superfamily enzyme